MEAKETDSASGAHSLYDLYTLVGDGQDGHDVFGQEEGHAIKYKTLSWFGVAMLMIAEIVSNGMLSLPFAVAVVGIVPGLILIAFLGIFATYTSWLLVRFKLLHPEVHTMGDAGFILMGPFGRELLGFGTVVFAVFASGSQLFAGELALSSLSDGKLCSLLYTGIFAAATLLCSFPRTFDRLSWLGTASVICIIVSGIVGMVGAGLHPVPVEKRPIQITVTATFFNAFSAVLNPVFAYAGHFMFFALISEMKHPNQAMRSAYLLQSIATSIYIVFAAVTYVFLGPAVASPSFLSLNPVWAKAAFGIALPNFLVAGALYTHLAAKLVFVRMFRGTVHLHEHTVIGWCVWTILIVLMNGAAFVLAVGVPIFNFLVGLAASLFAAWYTYGIAGGFWLFDSWRGGYKGYNETGAAAWKKRWFQATLCFATIVAGAFICVAGVYVSIRGIVLAYQTHEVPPPFLC